MKTIHAVVERFKTGNVRSKCGRIVKPWDAALSGESVNCERCLFDITKVPMFQFRVDWLKPTYGRKDFVLDDKSWANIRFFFDWNRRHAPIREEELSITVEREPVSVEAALAQAHALSKEATIEHEAQMERDYLDAQQIKSRGTRSPSFGKFRKES